MNEQRRLTKIVCTLGPASKSAEQIEALAQEGMNIARVNLSHGTQEGHTETIKILKELNSSGKYCIAILLDTKGAEIRTGEVRDPIAIKKGEEVIFSPHSLSEVTQKVIRVNYDGFSDDVRETNVILIDNGELSLDILSINDDGTVLAKARQDGSIGSRRHVNLPGADIDLPSVTQKDWEDIAFAVEEDIDFLALSFIRTAEEVGEVRRFLDERKSDIRIITKIETQQAVDNIADIIDASDAIMVARGDLGADIPFENLPVIQNEIVYRCRDAGKPVIVATHMLESMTEHPIPTRAEVTDVAHAATTKADATMLSGETASGRHPLVALSAMDRILRATEQHIARFERETAVPIHGEREARAEAAVTLSRSADVDAIIVFTRGGQTAQEVSKYRPRIPVIALTPTESMQRKLQLLYGVSALVIPFGAPEDTVQAGLQAAQEAGLLTKGNHIVLISDTQAKDALVSTVQVREVN